MLSSYHFPLSSLHDDSLLIVTSVNILRFVTLSLWWENNKQVTSFIEPDRSPILKIRNREPITLMINIPREQHDWPSNHVSLAL